MEILLKVLISSRARPHPLTTQVKGSSATDTLRLVALEILSARPPSKAPPPASTIPSTIMSPASSGGVSS